MQGKQSGQQELISTIDLESLILQNHILRKIEKILYLDFLYDLTEELYCLDDGRPLIDCDWVDILCQDVYLPNRARDRCWKVSTLKYTLASSIRTS